MSKEVTEENPPPVKIRVRDKVLDRGGLLIGVGRVVKVRYSEVASDEDDFSTKTTKIYMVRDSGAKRGTPPVPYRFEELRKV